MTRTNENVAREALAAFNRGDFEAAAEHFDPDAEWEPYLGALQGTSFRGRAELVAMWSDIADNFDGGFRLEIMELVSEGDAVAAAVEGYGIARSGVEIRQRWAQLLTFREGLIRRVQQPFPDIRSALDEAGAG